ncbi:MAG: MFS transporter, partial [Arsenophonus sp. ER-EMS1-MAG3]
ITHAIGLHGLFWGISLLTFCAVLIISFIVPDSQYHIIDHETHFIKNSIKKIINNTQLIKINLSILFLHLLLISNFIALPLIIKNSGLEVNQHWKIYLITLFISFIIVLPFVIYAEKNRRIKQILLLFIFILFISQLILTKIVDLKNKILIEI